jgi:hypothetical protein
MKFSIITIAALVALMYAASQSNLEHTLLETQGGQFTLIGVGIVAYLFLMFFIFYVFGTIILGVFRWASKQ